MHRKMQKYALRTLKIDEKSFNSNSNLNILFFEYQNEIFDEDFIQWNKDEKKHTSQINRILNIMTSHVN